MCKFKAALKIDQHQERFEEFVSIIEDDCLGDIYELEVSEDLEQLFELVFINKHDAVACKVKLRAAFPDIELTEINYAQ